MTDENLSFQAEQLRSEVRSFTVAVQDLAEKNDATRRLSKRVGILTGAVLVLGGFFFWDDYRDDQNEADKERAEAAAGCESSNEIRNVIRTMVHDGGVESGLRGGEALLQVASATRGPVDPKTAELYRQVLTEQLDPGLTAIVNQLPGRRWNENKGECVDVLLPPTEPLE